MRQKAGTIDVPIFEYEVYLISFQDYKYANKKLEKWGFESRLEKDDVGLCYEEVITHDNKFSFKASVLAVKHSEDYEYMKNTIAHETFHLTQHILENAGINFRKGGANEPYTYLNSWLQNKIEKFIIE